jgi:hypothetical protein
VRALNSFPSLIAESQQRRNSNRKWRAGRCLRRLRTGAAGALVLLVFVTALTTTASAAARGSGRAAQISFYANIGNPIGDPALGNPLVVQPTTVLLTEDGSWVLTGLHWTGWGSSVAHASGTSSARSCQPNCAAGKRKTTPVQLTLSNPVSVLGHQVYGCFRMTLPALPSANQHLCIKREGSEYGYSPVSTPPAKTPPASTHPSSTGDVAFFTPSRNISCALYDPGDRSAFVNCVMKSPEAIATISSRGVDICQHARRGFCTMSFGRRTPPFHVLPYGTSATAGRFRCSSAANGVTCVVASTGKGFFISKQLVRPVG